MNHNVVGAYTHYACPKTINFRAKPIRTAHEGGFHTDCERPFLAFVDILLGVYKSRVTTSIEPQIVGPIVRTPIRYP